MIDKMALPTLSTPVVPAKSKGSITLMQKNMNKGLIFAALHRGSSTIALGDRYALSFTRIDDKNVSAKLIMYDIETKSYTNIPYQPRARSIPKKKVVKKPKYVKKKEEGCDEL